MSQERLAFDAEVSPRHLSFLETGRSAPSREMVLYLASAMDLPLRERNELLVAAGFAPVYAHHSLEDVELEYVTKALDHLLAAHEPFGALAINRSHDILKMNQGAMRLFAWATAGRTVPPEVTGNLLRGILHPEGLRPAIVGWESLARQMIARLRHDVAHRPSPELSNLLAEVTAYEGLGDIGRGFDIEVGLPFAIVHLRNNGVDLRLFTMLTTIGTPLDVTAQEVAIESYHPADRATAEALRSMAQAAPGSTISASVQS